MAVEAQEAAFLAFARNLEPRLRAALVVRFGPVRGREAAAETLAWAWEHWERLERVGNRGGYLYRVGCRRGLRWRWSRPLGAVAETVEETWVEPQLDAALASLTVMQRQAVVLIEAYGLTYAEVAALLGVSRSTVQVHVARGLTRLRRALGVVSDV
jgi:DNA-directed RNA polymerase specialized sigma24 family protein